MANTTYGYSKAISLTDYLPAFRQKEKEQLWDWGKLCTKKTTKRATEQVFSFSGLPAANQIKELEPMVYYDMHELDATTFTVAKYGLGTMFSYELLNDNLHLPDLLEEAGDAMGESHAYIKAQSACAPFNRAFNSSYRVDPNTASIPLCSDSHVTKSGDTFDNDLGTLTLTWDNLWSAVNHFETTLLSQSGLYLMDTPKYLLYHPSLEKDVRAILESSQVPGTADNDKNTLKGMGITPVSSRFLTSTYWFLIGSRFKRDFLFFDREGGVKKAMKDDFDRMGTKVRTFQRFVFGVRDFPYIVGAQTA